MMSEKSDDSPSSVNVLTSSPNKQSKNQDSSSENDQSFSKDPVCNLL